jgi:hypothetical protein
VTGGHNRRLRGTEVAVFGRMPIRLLFLIALLLTGHLLAQTSAEQPVGGLPEVPFQALSDRSLTALGQAALTIRPADWKHAETTNFIYHYFQSFIVGPVSVEAEFYYRVIAKELEKDTTQWERKCHIFVFETDADWAEFQRKGSLDPWTGGIHSGGSLFIQRNPQVKFKGNTLGHEVAHLVVERFYGAGVPLWLNEGYAEYVSARCYAAFNRARGYNARPHSRPVPAGLFLPLAQLTSMLTYPKEVVEVGVFYSESERLVRFLSATDKRGFGVFLEALSKGNRFETGLTKGFGGRFINLDALEREFKSYAIQENGTANSD